MSASHLEIRAALAQCGPMTSADLVVVLQGPSQRDVASACGKMRNAAVKTVYICHWEMHAAGQKSTPRPVYALGDLPDAPKPRKQPNRVASARYRAKRRAASALGKPNSVFQLARFL